MKKFYKRKTKKYNAFISQYVYLKNDEVFSDSALKKPLGKITRLFTYQLVCFK